MIKVKGSETILSGGVLEIIVEVGIVITALKESLENNGLSKEAVDQIITITGRMAYAESIEKHAEIKEDLIKCLSTELSEGRGVAKK